jgi:undecaprenyl diphosphate synthase
MNSDGAHNIPAHIGIIMDGNGRWATQRGQARSRGHREGLEAAKRVAKALRAQGVQYVSLYAFSTENWRRAPDEVKFLMGLLSKNLRKELPFYQENNIRILYSGDIAGLPKNVQAELHRVTEETSDLDGLYANLAVNYGGRNEIVRAVKRWLGTANGSATAESFDESAIKQYLDRPDFPDPDLIIRTGGERRISNFLLWECAYAEFYFSPVLWPDWGAEEVQAALEDFQSRKRNFGGVR